MVLIFSLLACNLLQELYAHLDLFEADAEEEGATSAVAFHPQDVKVRLGRTQGVLRRGGWALGMAAGGSWQQERALSHLSRRHLCQAVATAPTRSHQCGSKLHRAAGCVALVHLQLRVN